MRQEAVPAKRAQSIQKSPAIEYNEYIVKRAKQVNDVWADVRTVAYDQVR